MTIELSSRRARCCFLFLAMLAAGEFSYVVARVWIAVQWSESQNPRHWIAAAKTEPGDAEYWEQLGRYYQFNLAGQDLSKAAGYLQRAAEINPRSERSWLELAVLDENRGDSPAARRAYKKAQSNFPVSPDVAWRYGSFLLRQGDYSEGFIMLKRALDSNAFLEASVLAECRAVDPDADSIARKVLPQKEAYYVRAVRYFLSRKQTDAALAMWKQLLKLNQPTAMTDAIDLIDDLIDRGRVSEAHQVWCEALQRSGWPGNANDNASLVFNGGFEVNSLNGGFDWRELPVSDVSYDIDSGVAHSERRSLRITFDGAANINFQHVFQYVPVASRHRYQFLAYVRTDGIPTGGARFEIFDPRHPQEPHAITPVVAGANEWTPLRIDFESGVDTHVLEVLLRIAQGTGFENQLRGIVWVDDVSLLPIAARTVGAGR
ncbi:MAG TPA: tetratricopeptide repeat protein [Candidatus Acidoferrales bacterium]|nr:tetratricopeptide repeat protein [Candidatus Acidoferrales bacterium]